LKIKLLFFLSLLIVAFQLLISFPITIWVQNQFNFGVELLYAISLLGMVFCGISAFLFLVTLLVPEKIRAYLLPLFALTSVLVYLQQNVLVWDYGFLDGKQIDFHHNNYLGLIDLLLWGSGVLIFMLFRKQVTKRTGVILLFSGLLTVLATVFAVSSLGSEQYRSPGTITDLDKFSFSDQENILLFVLDGFQSDLFWELIDNEPGLKDEFAGFTFYPDTSSVFAKTYPTIPLLLTGRTYSKQQPFQEFLSQSYKNSLLTSLVANGWSVGLYPHIKATVSADDSIMSNYVRLVGWDEKVDNYLLALDLSLFRAAPHFLKSLVYKDGDFILQKTLGEYFDSSDILPAKGEIVSLPKHHAHEGLNFLTNLQTSANSKPGKSTFKFYHLNMPHKPFLLDRDLNYGLRTEGFNEYREYAYASVKLAIKYLKELKRIGVYDNSSIIITADHGGGEYTSNKYLSAEKKYISINEDGPQKASGKPLLLIKRDHDDHPFRISSKSMSLLDIAPTIASFANLDDEEFAGVAVDELLTSEPRARIYYFYNFTGFDSKYLGDFYVYQIEGDVYDESAWKMKGQLTAPQDNNNSGKYVLNSFVSYGSDAKSSADYMNAFLVGDNYLYEPSRIISNSGELDISLRLEENLNDDEVYLLELEVTALNESSTVRTNVNSLEVVSFLYQNDMKRKLAFLNPKEIGAKDKLDIHLETSRASSDGGPLSISKLSLRPANLAHLDRNSIIRFSNDLEGHHLNGFWAAESWGRWTSSTESTFHFFTTDDFCRDSYIHLKVGRFNNGVNPEKFMVYLNGEMLKLVRLEKNNDRTDYYYECTQNQLRDHDVNKLIFSTDKSVPPISLGNNTDPRKFYVGLLGLEFIDKRHVSFD